MMDIGISSGPPGADLVAMSKGARTGKQDDGDGKGFLDALSSSKGGARGAKTSAKGASDTNDTVADDDLDASKDDAAKADPTTVPTTDVNVSKTDTESSMIDPSATNIANLAELAKGPKQPAGPKFPAGVDVTRLTTSLAGFQKSPLTKTVPDGKSETTDVDAPALPEADVADAATTLADAIAVAQSQQDASAGKDGAPVVKTGKGGTAAATTDTKPASVQDANASGAVTDALTLLNVPATVNAAAVAPSVASALVGDTAGATDGAAQDQPLGKIAGATIGSSAADAMSSTDDAAPAAGTDATQAFRLVRANGRGGSLDIAIGKGSDDSAQFEVKGSPSGNAETVTVVDSRRFLGLAPNSNSALVAGALAGDREWAGAMQPGSALANAASWTSTGKVVNTLKIEMHPADLGVVTATMRLSGDQLSVDLKVQSGEAYRQLHADQSHIVDALRAQGYAVDNISVTLAPSSDQQDSGRQSNFQGQPQQQSAMNHGQGGDARPKGQNYSGQQANGQEGSRSSSDRGMEDGASGGAQRLRSGDVYL